MSCYETNYTPSHRVPGESPAEYFDRLRDEEIAFNEAHCTEREAEKARFDGAMEEANGQEWPHG